jgi:hypothetical protein
MASNYTNLGVQLMTTGEKAGTWGTLTNTNWDIIEQIAGGYVSQALTDNGTLTLTKNDGTTGATLATRIWKLTGTLSVGNSIITVPDSIENWWLVNNAEGGSTYTVTVKTVSGTGVEWAAGETGYKLLYTDGTNVIDAGFAAGDVTLTGTQTLTNKTLTLPIIASISNSGTVTIPTGADTLVNLASAQTLSTKTLTAPKIVDGGFIADGGGDENLVFGEVGTPVNELKITNAATGAGPILASISTSGTDTNIDINVNPGGTGVLKSGTAAVKIAGKETMWVPATAMYASTTNGAEATQTELTAGNPELKTFDFDTTTAESVQFNVSFPESWNADTITFQTMWSASGTDAGTGGFTLAGCSVANNIDYDLAFGTVVANTALAASTTQDDLMINVESGAVTIASAADSTNTIFRLVRDTAVDTNTGDLRLVGVKIFYTTDAANDA